MLDNIFTARNINHIITFLLTGCCPHHWCKIIDSSKVPTKWYWFHILFISECDIEFVDPSAFVPPDDAGLPMAKNGCAWDDDPYEKLVRGNLQLIDKQKVSTFREKLTLFPWLRQMWVAKLRHIWNGVQNGATASVQWPRRLLRHCGSLSCHTSLSLVCWQRFVQGLSQFLLDDGTLGKKADFYYSVGPWKEKY